MSETVNYLLRAVQDCLSDDVHVREVLGDPPRIHDRIVEDAVHPFLSYGEVRAETLGSDAPATALTVNLHLYTRYRGRAEAMKILAHILSALGRDNLKRFLPGLVSSVSRYTDSFAARDAHIRHSIMRITFTVDEEVLSDTLAEAA